MDNIDKQLDVFFYSWQQLDAQYTEFAKTKGISYTGLIVMTYIYRETQGKCTQKYLCEKTLMPKQTINSVINGFVKKGLVVLREMEGDRRNKCITLTEKGKELYQEMDSVLAKAEKSTVSQIDPEKWEQLVETLSAYSSIFQKEMKKI